MLTKLCLTLTFAVAPLSAAALCDGPDFLERLTPAERTSLDAAVAATPFAEGLLWQATRDDRRITLIGTMHIDAPSLPALRAAAAPFVDTADLLLVEATEAEESALLAAFAAQPDLYLITEGPTLPDLLDPDLWTKVTQAATARDIPPFMVAQFQPWYLGLTLSIPPCATAGLASGAKGLDHMIITDAQAAGVPVQPLEPWETLINVLRDGGMDDQIAQLSVALPPVDLQEAIFATMLNGYAAGQTALMWEASRIAVSHIPDIDPAYAQQIFADTEQGLLIDRNLDWMPVIADASATHPDLVVAAGAAHLPGDFGLLTLLQDDGWTITRLD